MDFEPTDTQRQMVDSLARRLRERAATVPSGRPAWDRDAWRVLGELGLTALPFDASVGGLGGDAVDTMLVMQELGRSLATTPYLATVVQAGAAIARGADPDLRERLLGPIARGESIVAWAPGGFDAHPEPPGPAAPGGGRGAAWSLTGRAELVPFADEADRLVVAARPDGAGASPRLFALERHARGVAVHASRRIDGVPAGRIELVAAAASPLSAEPLDATPIVVAVEQVAIAAAAADALGSMEEALRLTLDHLRTRRQFGVPIGGFQALQHRAADMFVAIELARSMAMHAAVCVDVDDPHEREAGVRAAKIVVDRAARVVGDGAIQLHGGIGMTDEYAVGHHARRLAAFRASHGDTDHHARRLAELQAVIEFP